MKDMQVVYYIAYGFLSVLGTIVHPFFYIFHLTEILLRYPTLTNVLYSVYVPRKQLGLTGLLYILLNYLFTIVAYAAFYDYYNGNCNTLYICFFYTFD